MPTREEMIAHIKSQAERPKSREEMIAHIRAQVQPEEPEEPEGPGLGAQLVRSTLDTLPTVGALTGGLVGTIAGAPTGPGAIATGVGGAAIGYAGGSELADLGKQYLLGDRPTANVLDQPLETGKRVVGNLAEGAMAEMGGQIAGKAIGKAATAVRDVSQNVSSKSKALAEKFAVNATGATGKQTEKFADDAGRQLLDRKLIKFGDSTEKIAERVGKAEADAADEIQKALRGLDDAGAKANVDDILKSLRSRANQLESEPSTADVARKLRSIIDDIDATKGKIIDRGGYTVKGDKGFKGQIIDRGSYTVPGKEAQVNQIVDAGTYNVPATPGKSHVTIDPVTGMPTVRTVPGMSATSVPIKAPTRTTINPKTGMPEALPDVAGYGPSTVGIAENTALRTNPKTGMQEAIADRAPTRDTFVPIVENTRLRTNPLTGMQEERALEVPLSAAEKTKRGYGQKIKNWIDPQSGAANKEAYVAYMKEVEKKALEKNPELASLFKEAKEAYGLLAPIEEAASKRVATLAQSQPGNLLDMATAGVGTVATGGAGGMAAGAASAVGRRVLAPRLSSSAAVTLDKISKRLSTTPRAKALIERSPTIVSAISRYLSPTAEAMPAAAKNGTAQDGDSAIADIKGENKWAVDGLAKVIEHSGDASEAQIEKLLASKKGKNLLVQASAMKPGSKGMENILNKIKKDFADEK